MNSTRLTQLSKVSSTNPFWISQDKGKQTPMSPIARTSHTIIITALHPQTHSISMDHHATLQIHMKHGPDSVPCLKAPNQQNIPIKNIILIISNWHFYLHYQPKFMVPVHCTSQHSITYIIFFRVVCRP